jgi:hypothetical protein
MPTVNQKRAWVVPLTIIMGLLFLGTAIGMTREALLLLFPTTSKSAGVLLRTVLFDSFVAFFIRAVFVQVLPDFSTKLTEDGIRRWALHGQRIYRWVDVNNVEFRGDDQVRLIARGWQVRLMLGSFLSPKEVVKYIKDHTPSTAVGQEFTSRGHFWSCLCHLVYLCLLLVVLYLATIFPQMDEFSKGFWHRP